MNRRLAIINSDAKREPVLPDPDGVTSVLVDLRMRAFARTPYDHILTELSTIDAGERAVADGCDALYIDTLGDYGIARLRAAVPVPVVGAGEASLATDVHYISDEPELDLVGTDDGVKARMKRGETDIIATIAAACRRAVAGDGTDLVLFGCTCMTPVAGEVAARTGLEIHDPSKIGLRAAFSAAAGGERFDAPAASRLGAVGDLVSSHLHGVTHVRAGLATVATGIAVDAVAADECEVCVVMPT